MKLRYRMRLKEERGNTMSDEEIDVTVDTAGDSSKSNGSEPKKKKPSAEASRQNIYLIDPTELTIVGIDSEDEGDLRDERIHLPVREALVKSIIKHGVLHPVLVRKNGSFSEVIDGRQRVRAARVANERLAEAGEEGIKVPVIIKRPEDLMGTSIATFLRTEDDPLTKAKKASRYIEKGHSEAEAAEIFDVTKAAIKNWLAMLDLSPKVQKAIESGKVAANTALELKDLTHEDQATKLSEMLANGTATMGAAKAARSARAKGKEEPAFKGPPKSVLRKIVENPKFTENLEPQSVQLLEWILGGKQPRIKGLQPALKEAKYVGPESEE